LKAIPVSSIAATWSSTRKDTLMPNLNAEILAADWPVLPDG
jgi:hypothetical protein